VLIFNEDVGKALKSVFVIAGLIINIVFSSDFFLSVKSTSAFAEMTALFRHPQFLYHKCNLQKLSYIYFKKIKK